MLIGVMSDNPIIVLPKLDFDTKVWTNIYFSISHISTSKETLSFLSLQQGYTRELIVSAIKQVSK